MPSDSGAPDTCIATMSARPRPVVAAERGSTAIWRGPSSMPRASCAIACWPAALGCTPSANSQLVCTVGSTYEPGLQNSDESPAGAGSTAQGSEEHTSELQSLMRSSYAALCLKQ